MTSIAVPRPAAILGARTGLGWALMVFIWLLPFHVVTMAVLFGLFGLPGPVVRTIAAWKEALVAALVALSAARALTGHGPRLPVRTADLAVAGLGLLALVYLLGAGVWFGSDLPVGLQSLGLRDAVFFTLLYFVGRAAPEIADDPRYLRALVAVGVVTSVIAIVERLLVTPEMLVLLGAAHYVQELLGLAVTTVHNPYGLPDSYWTFLGDRMVQRAGSTYLSSQGFAVPFLIILPAATLALFTAEKRRAWAGLGCAVLWAGLLLTVTRMTTLVCVLQVLLLAALYRRWGAAVGGALVVLLGVAVAALVVPGFATFIWQTVTWESVSSVSHLEDWTEGMAYLVEHPLGVGLGAGGLTAARFGLPTVAADSQFFKYSVELGLLGLGLFVASLAGFLVAGARAFQSGRTGAVRRHGALVAVATLGIALNGATTILLTNPFLAYAFFWLAGTAVSVSDERP
jgi:hypothetical protein